VPPTWPRATSCAPLGRLPPHDPLRRGSILSEDKIDVHDLHATLLHQQGIDHERLTDKFQGRDDRLTDVHGTVIREILT